MEQQDLLQIVSEELKKKGLRLNFDETGMVGHCSEVPLFAPVLYSFFRPDNDFQSFAIMDARNIPAQYLWRIDLGMNQYHGGDGKKMDPIRPEEVQNAVAEAIKKYTNEFVMKNKPVQNVGNVDFDKARESMIKAMLG